MINKIEIPKLDLLIIDIDDTFIYHRTVAIANKLFIQAFCSLFGRKIKEDVLYTTKKTLFIMIKCFILNFFRLNLKKETIKRIAKLSKTAIILYYLNAFRSLNNRYFKIISSEKIIRIWAKSILSLSLKSDEYSLKKEVIKKNLNKKVFRIYDSLRTLNPKMKVAAITQNFAIGKDPIKNIINLDYIESNRFMLKKGIIADFHPNVRNKEDKKSIAEDIIKKYRSKRIGLFIQDYDDLLLLKLNNIRFILYNSKLERFISKKVGINMVSFK